MLNAAKRFLRDERGQGMGEYALILALVAIGVILTLTALGGQIRSKFQEITNTLQNANPQ